MSMDYASTPDNFPTTRIGLDKTPEKSLWGHDASICPAQDLADSTAFISETKAMTIAAPRVGCSSVRRENPSEQEPSNEEGLFMAPKPPGKNVIMSASAPEMWVLKHGPPPKRPRFRPVPCFKEPAPLDLPEPDVPMSGPDVPSKMAASCPAYVAFCINGRSLEDSSGLCRFGVPAGHAAGTPTMLETLDSMTLGSIEESKMEGTGWESTDDEMFEAQSAMEEETDGSDDKHDEQDDGDLFSFDFTPPDEK